MTRKSQEELIEGFLHNNLSDEELVNFLTLLKEDKIDPQLREYVDRLFAASADARPVSDEAERESVFEQIVGTEAPVVPIRRRAGVYWMTGIAAAMLLLVAGVWLYWKKPVEKPMSEKAVVSVAQVKQKGNKATLKLADGTVVALDDAKNGELAKQGGSKVIKIDGKLAYSASSVDEVLYNTISTPRGGQYQVELADGTIVWLNAASSLHFPTAFKGKERSVEITGEAYLEVAKNKDKPFVVVVNGSRIEVLGTSFNVSAYADERQLTTTLLEGSVKFVNGDNETLLAPGQQSRLSNGRVKRVDNVDVNAVIAWKNGMFHFENATIETIMNQLARWYDVDLVYEDGGFQNKRMGDVLHADIPRDTKLDDVLKALEIACKAKFQIEDKKIIIKH
ncbi:MAG: FecR domain-containing protein [Bacteroidetes bacterium]|nr:FecR domain-containing protein [Bacteroidota bacterium]